MLEHAAQAARSSDAKAVLLLIDAPMSWETLIRVVGIEWLIVAADSQAVLEGAKEAGLRTIVLDMEDSPMQEKLTQAVLEAVAEDFIAPRSTVIAAYSGFEAGSVDSISVIHLGEHLERLTSRDLRELATSVPLDTLKAVVDLCTAIGREGREGKPVGTLFVVGDSRKVLSMCHPTGFDPVRGYSRKERNITDPKVREGLKEIALMDGAFIVAGDGTVEAAAQFVNAPASDVALSKGFGARHWTAAAVSHSAKCVAVTVSESTGTVRVFQNGEIVLRIEPFRRPMKWKEFEYDPPSAAE